MATLSLAEWMPDLPALNTTGITIARNVVPLTPLSYGALPSLKAFTGNKSINPIPPLPEQPYGLYSFIDSNSNEHIYTGTRTKLYEYKTGNSQFKDVSAFITHYALASATIANQGTSYTVGDVLTIRWEPSGTAAQITVNSVDVKLYHLSGADIEAGGTAYTAGDVVTLVGGTFTTAATITIDSVSGGIFATGHISEPGSYSVQPSDPVSVTGGTGTGLTFNLSWITDPLSEQILTYAVSAVGDHTSIPTNPVSVVGGSGTGATFNITTSTISTENKPYTALPYDPWQMVGFGNSIVCTNANDPPQVLNIDTDSNFSDLNSNRAPFGKYVCVCRNFLVFANVFEPQNNTYYPQRVHWSAIGDASTWPDLGSQEATQLQSDAQDVRADLGHITGIASNLQAADMAILLDMGVYSVRYVGSPAIFDFQIAQGAVGCQLSQSVVVNRGFMYYYGLDGFYAFDGTTPDPIGAMKVDKWFLTDPIDGADPNYLYTMQATADPTGRLIMWSYRSRSSEGGNDRLLIYNYILKRWSMARIEVALLGRGLTTGYSLDQLDQFGTIEEITPSLDDPYWSGGKPYLLAFDADNQVMAFTGPNLAATLTTQEGQPTEGKRSRVTSIRPLIDGGTPSVTVISRNRLEDNTVAANPVTINVWGTCPVRVDARYLRGQIDIPAASSWSHALGLELEFGASTSR